MAQELEVVEVPVITVLGNHDYHANQEQQVRRELERRGVAVLEGERVTFALNGQTVGVAGTKGFGGGFAGACGSTFGEPEMKAFIHHTEQLAARLEEDLRALQTDYRIALLHYSPVKDRLAGERLEIYPFLGSYLLAEAIDAVGADLVVHGHAHHGAEKGVTARGVPVRNVALPLLRSAYALYNLEKASPVSSAARRRTSIGEQPGALVTASQLQSRAKPEQEKTDNFLILLTPRPLFNSRITGARCKYYPDR